MADERTEVMSLDELMDLASDPSGASTVQLRRPSAPTPAPAPLNPGSPQPIAQRPAAQRPVALPDLGALLEQSGEKLSIAGEQARRWLRHGDNGIIAATVALAVLLLVVIASL